MAKIKIHDLKKDVKISKEEIRRVMGGAAFIKFNSIDGESLDKDHKGWSDISAFESRLKWRTFPKLV